MNTAIGNRLQDSTLGAIRYFARRLDASLADREGSPRVAADVLNGLLASDKWQAQALAMELLLDIWHMRPMWSDRRVYRCPVRERLWANLLGLRRV